jgi:hypothetical protein
MEAFNKGALLPRWEKSGPLFPPGTPIEIWFQNEARVGQKNKIAPRLSRRTEQTLGAEGSAEKIGLISFIFGAICTQQGKGGGLVLPFCNTKAMDLHPAEISLAAAPGAHAVVLLDQAGWHATAKLKMPSTISIITRPAKCPEPNPIGNIWQCKASKTLTNQPLAHHVQRHAVVSAWVVIHAGWYKGGVRDVTADVCR